MKQFTIIEQLDNKIYTLYDSGEHNVLREYEGFEFADVRNSIDLVAGEYGAVYVNSKYGKRRMGLRGDFTGSDIFNQRRLLNRALRQTGTMKLLKFTTFDDLQLQCEAELTKLVNPYTHKVHGFMIEFTAPDWRFYTQALKSYDVSQTIVLGGASIPAEIPMSIASPTSSGSDLSNIIINDGNEQTDPVFTIHGPATGITIRNVTTDKEFFLDHTLDGDDVVVIDVKRRTVIKNGITNIYGDFDGDFWSVIPGQNELRFLVNSGLLLGTTNLNVSFRDAYNGI